MIEMHDLPFPYRSLLAVCSDLDETPDFDRYVEISRFLNTAESTTMGDGVDLEVGNSLYFYMNPDQFAYFGARRVEQEAVIELIRAGLIDCFHSFGDLATSRTDAEAALAELERHGCRMRVWIDHATAPTNLGADIMQGHGDVPGAEAYHADLLVASGVEYVWRGRVTSVIGQDVPRSLAGIADWARPIESARTLAKECSKGLLGRLPGNRYRSHVENRVVFAAELRDGQPVWEFLRANPHRGGVSSADRGDRIGEVLSDSMIDVLASRRGTSIVYTHLGKNRTDDGMLPPTSVGAFRRLAERQSRGDVLVATTERVLDYCRLRRDASWRVQQEGSVCDIHVDAPAVFLDGLGFRVPGDVDVRLFVNGEAVPGLRRHASPDGRTADVFVPWGRRRFPALGRRN